MNQDSAPRQRVVLSLASYTDTESTVLGKRKTTAYDTLVDLARDLNIPMHHDPQIASLLISLRLQKNIPASVYAAASAVLSCIYQAARSHRHG